MICPHCGKQTANASLCEHCGCSTEFAVRTNYQSVGTSSNEISCPPVQNAEPDQNHQPGYCPYQEQRVRSRLVPWLFGTVVLLLVTCIVATIAFSWLLKKVDKLTEQISSVQHFTVEEDTREIPTTIAFSDTLQEETEAIASIAEGINEGNTTDQESEELTVLETGDTEANEETIPEEKKILISFDVNPLAQMELFDLSPETPEAISVKQEMPFLCDVTDPFHGSTWYFTEWNTKPDGTGLSIRLGQIIDLPLSESITLFAQWEELDESFPPEG